MLGQKCLLNRSYEPLLVTPLRGRACLRNQWLVLLWQAPPIWPSHCDHARLAGNVLTACQLTAYCTTVASRHFCPGRSNRRLYVYIHTVVVLFSSTSFAELFEQEIESDTLSPIVVLELGRCSLYKVKESLEVQASEPRLSSWSVRRSAVFNHGYH